MIYRFISIILVSLIHCQSSLFVDYAYGKPLRLPSNLAVQYQGRQKIGKPYKIKGKIYHPKPIPQNKIEIGYASWYRAHKSITANGDMYFSHRLTAAHKTLPMPCLIKVTNLHNNRKLILLVNDRGPFIKNRILDVSEYSAELLGFKRQGVAKVKVEFLFAETKKLINLIFCNNHKSSTKDCKVCDTDYYVKLLNKSYKTSYYFHIKNKSSKKK